MSNSRGFTLIETLITIGVLVWGLVAVASIFSYSASTNLNNQQGTTATVLLYDKMEQFKATSDKSVWSAGGSLNPESPATGYFDYVKVSGTGGVTVNTTDTEAPFMRVWQITGTTPRSLTVAIFARKAGLRHRRLELIRASSLASSKF